MVSIIGRNLLWSILVTMAMNCPRLNLKLPIMSKSPSLFQKCIYLFFVSARSSWSEPRLALVGSDAQHGASGRRHGDSAV